MEIIQGTCSCGEVISIELNADPNHAAAPTGRDRFIRMRTLSPR